MSAVKILHVIVTLNPTGGGPMQGLRNFLPVIYKWGYRNEVVCLDDPKETFIGKDSFIVHALGPSKRPWGYAPKLLPWLKGNVQRFDAILVHGLWQYHGYAVNESINWLKANGEGKLPVVAVMPHGMLDPYFQKAPERKWKAMRNNIYWKLIEEKVINESSAIFFTCAEELRLARKTFSNYKPKREINVGYGIAEPPAFSPQMTAAFEEKCPEPMRGKPFLLFLSRIHSKKGIDLLIRAYAELKKAQESSVEQKALPYLLVAGPGLETAYGQEMQRLVQELGLQEQVIFPGMLTGDAKWGAFYGCEAFVLSSHQENFGIAVAEALACSKPVLISNQINIWREIEEAGGGFVENDNLSGTKALLTRWMNLTEEEKRNFSIAARASYEKHFAVDAAARQLIRVILKMIAANGISV